MEYLEANDHRLRYSGFYNIYPISNEMSASGAPLANPTHIDSKHILDDYYGRVFDTKLYANAVPYGASERLKHYPSGISGKIVDELRVPYRKVPIYELNSLKELPPLIKNIEDANSQHEILLRGQKSLYTIPREEAEIEHLFGDKNAVEPSFLPSHLRNNFDERFMHGMWHSQATILLHDVGAEYGKMSVLLKEVYEEHMEDSMKVKRSPHLSAFALGIAQHYGMPSIGLDLTKTVHTAAWFAMHHLDIDNDGMATTKPIDDFKESTLYIFRCPRNSVFSYRNVRPRVFPLGRPDKQDAWFGHVGWGCAKNQLGSYLVCGFRLSAEMLNEIPAGYDKQIFPPRWNDPMLDFFLKMKAMEKYEGEAKRALSKIYELQE